MQSSGVSQILPVHTCVYCTSCYSHKLRFKHNFYEDPTGGSWAPRPYHKPLGDKGRLMIQSWCEKDRATGRHTGECHWFRGVDETQRERDGSGGINRKTSSPSRCCAHFHLSFLNRLQFLQPLSCASFYHSPSAARIHRNWAIKQMTGRQTARGESRGLAGERKKGKCEASAPVPFWCPSL